LRPKEKGKGERNQQGPSSDGLDSQGKKEKPGTKKKKETGPELTTVGAKSM